MSIARNTLILTLLSAALPLVSPSSASAGQRLKLFEITFPQPKKRQMKRLADLRIITRRVVPHIFASTDIIFYLSKKGRVDSIGWDGPQEDSLVFRPYQDSLLATRFEAAKIHGKKSAFALSARLYALGDRFGARAVVDLPVNETGELLNYPLALKSLRRYGYQPPELRRFPSYFYRKLDVTDNKELLYQFAIVKVELDSTGAPRDREVYFTTDDELGEMIQVASGWAEYEPAELDGHRIASDGFVFVRFFREIPYPVGPWTSGSDSSSMNLEKMRVSWFPGEILPDIAPVQKGNQNLQVTLPLSFSQNTFKEARLRVSSLGRALIADVNGVTGNVDRQLLLDKLKSTPFYPGFRLDADSTTGVLGIRRLSVLGRLLLTPLDSTTYRLETEFIDRYSTPVVSQSPLK